MWVWWFGALCCIHKGIYVLSVRRRRSSEPPSNFPNSKQPWRFWGSVVMSRRLSGSSWLRSTISVLREPPRVRLWIRRVFHSINKISDIIIQIFPDFYYTWCACQNEKASGQKYLKIYRSHIHLAASDWLLQSWTLQSAHVCKLIYSKFDQTSVRVTLLALPESYKVPPTQLLARHQSLIVDKHCHISRTKNINLVLAWSSFLSALLSEL